MATWSDVPWDLWHGEVVWMFLKNKEAVPDPEHLRWHWITGHGPGQTYYKLSVKHAPGPSGTEQSR